ncbi:hypothetical protein ACHAW5_009982 [Stephanodiscus triporus]|uniref:Uncharacterized protein n=1 Tax=Stephanodiscus triporus TaxID=2934178 RepID=A0ABD3PQY5_9STRA
MEEDGRDDDFGGEDSDEDVGPDGAISRFACDGKDERVVNGCPSKSDVTLDCGEKKSAHHVSSGGVPIGEEIIIKEDGRITKGDSRGARRPKRGTARRKRGRPQPRGRNELPRRHKQSNDAGRTRLGQSHNLASTSESTPVSREAHVGVSHQFSRIFQWSPITLQSPAKKKRKTINASSYDDTAPQMGAVGSRNASNIHPLENGKWSHGVLTMRVLPDDGQGTLPMAATSSKQRTDARMHMPTFSPIALLSLDDTSTNDVPSRVFQHTPAKNQEADDLINFSNWHTPTSFVGNAGLPSIDIDDLIACLGNDFESPALGVTEMNIQLRSCDI